MGLEKRIAITASLGFLGGMLYAALSDAKAEDIPKGCQPTQQFISILQKEAQAPVWRGDGDNGQRYHVYASKEGETWTLFRTSKTYACPVAQGVEWGTGGETPQQHLLADTKHCSNEKYTLNRLYKNTPKVALEGFSTVLGVNRVTYPSSSPLRLYAERADTEKQQRWALVGSIVPMVKHVINREEMEWPERCTYIEVMGKNGRSIPFKEPGRPI